MWLLRVWQTGPAAQAVSRTNPEWRHEFEETLPDLQDEDIAGSGFAIQSYTVHHDLGGDAFVPGYREANSPRFNGNSHGNGHSHAAVAPTAESVAKEMTTIIEMHVNGVGSTESGLSRNGLPVISDRNDQFKGFQCDAPACDSCGAITVRNGNCYLCHNCGASMGCSYFPFHDTHEMLLTERLVLASGTLVQVGGTGVLSFLERSLRWRLSCQLRNRESGNHKRKGHLAEWHLTSSRP